MFLYAFYPNGHGPYSFFVMANSEEEARAVIDTKCDEITDEHEEAYFYSDWKYGHEYTVEVYTPGQVAVNRND